MAALISKGIFHTCARLNTAENIAKKKSISRQEQDEFAVLSQQKAVSACQAGKFFKEIVNVDVPASRRGEQPKALDRDEFPRPETTLDSLANLKPAFIPVLYLVCFLAYI